MDKLPAYLVEWESSLEKELHGLRERRESVDGEIQRVAKKLELIRQMRLLEESPGIPTATETIAPSASETRPTPVLVRDGVKRILADSARPLHIAEIHREFLKRGLPIPGGGTPFNILAHVVNDRTFVRVARGTYALAGSVPEDQVLPRAPRKARANRRRRRNRVQGSED